MCGVEIWLTSNLRPLRLGEEKKKITRQKYNGLPYSRATINKLPSALHRTTLLGYIFVKARIDNGKNLLNSNIFSTCPHNNGERRPTNG